MAKTGFVGIRKEFVMQKFAVAWLFGVPLLALAALCLLSH